MEIKTYFSLIHLVGLIVGLGAVTTLDVYLIKLLRGERVSVADTQLISLVAKLASAGLALLWISGIAFLLILWANAPEQLANPKIHAKLIVVGILTLNGIILEFAIFPKLRESIGEPLFGPLASARGTAALRICVTISAASWWTAFTLGALRELNFAASIWTFLAAYGLALGVVAAGFVTLETALNHPRIRRLPLVRALLFAA